MQLHASGAEKNSGKPGGKCGRMSSVCGQLLYPRQDTTGRPRVQERTEGFRPVSHHAPHINQAHPGNNALDGGLLQLLTDLAIGVSGACISRLSSNAAQNHHVHVIEVLHLPWRRDEHMHPEEQLGKQERTGEHDLMSSRHQC